MKAMTISSKNQIVVSREIRDALKAGSGDKIIIDHIDGNKVTIKKQPTFRDIAGSLPNRGDDPVARIRKLRDEWDS